MDGYRLPILLAVLLVSACTITSVSNDAPNRSSRFDGTIWSLLFIDDDAAPGRPRPTLEFIDDGNVRGFAGCNRYHGTLWTSGDRIRFLDVGQQLTGCEERSVMELEARYLKTLNEIRNYRFDSGKLALLDAKRNVRLVLKRSEFVAMRAPGAAAVIGQPVAPGGAYASSSSGALPAAPYVTPSPPTIVHQEASPFPGLRAFGSIAPAMPASALQSATVVPLGRFTGVELVTMTSGLGKYFGVERGVLISRLPAVDALQIEEGDVVLSINGRQPANAEHAARILSSYRNGESLDIQIMRQQKPMTLKITQ
jgi:heat shock protein HslJ